MKNDKINDKDSYSNTPCNSDQKHEENVTAKISGSSVKSKKSGNILSALIKRTRKSKTKSQNIQSVENVHTSVYSLNYDPQSNSSFGGQGEEGNEVEINIQSYEQKEDQALIEINELDELNQFNTDEVRPLTTSVGSKMKKTPNSEPDCRNYKYRSIECGPAEFDLDNIDGQYTPKGLYELNADFNTSLNRDHYEDKTTTLPTTILYFEKVPMDIHLTDGLHYVQELCSSLTDNESYITQLIKKYIKDQSVQKELIDAISHHSKIQWEAERRANSLASDMWVQQTDISKAQERALQETLNSLVRQNRQLQIENETLNRKNESLTSKIRLLPQYAPRIKSTDNSYTIKLMKNNERLQSKIEAYIQQMEILEKELHVTLKQNDSLEHYTRNLLAQIQNLKATIQRIKSDYELEQTSILHQLHTNEKLIKDTIDTGDIVLEDLDALKRQMKEMPFTINWTKFKCRGSCLTDLLHVCRSCINELSRELILAHNQTCLKEKDIDTLRETNARLQENLQKSTTELNNLSKKIEDSSVNEVEKCTLEEKCKKLEDLNQDISIKLENKNKEFEKEKVEYLNIIKEKENNIDQILPKYKLFEESKKVITNITAENYALRCQINGLNRILSDSGSGDVAKELTLSQEKIAQYQKQYFQVLSEKNVLIDQINTMNTEKNNLAQYQEIYFQQLQAQLKDLESINNENAALKKHLEIENETIIALQGDCKRYLEEKEVLKSIFQHLKQELSKVGELESIIQNMSKESNRLTLIAEYNKQLGEKLKNEVQERDNTILDLRSSMEKLNNIQLEYAKDKLSLCAELSEVNNMKDKLNTSLQMQVQHNLVLDETQKSLENTTTTKIKNFEEIRKNERETLKVLLRDYKGLMIERDELLEIQKLLRREIDENKVRISGFNKKYDKLYNTSNEKEKKIKELNLKIDNYEHGIKNLEEKISVDYKKYDNDIKQSEKLIKQLRAEKEDLESCIVYLKANLKNMQHDLDSARAKEKETQDAHQKLVVKGSDLEKELHGYKKSMEILNFEKEKTVKEMNYLNNIVEKIFLECEAKSDLALKKEDIFIKEMEQSKNILVDSAKQLENLNKKLSDKNVEHLKLQQKHNELLKQIQCFIGSVEELSDKTNFVAELKKSKGNLLDELKIIQFEFQTRAVQTRSMSKDIESLQNQVKFVIDQKEEDNNFYKKQIDHLSREYKTQKEEMNKQIQELTRQVSNLKLSIKIETEKSENLNQIYKEITSKFTSSMQELAIEKNSNQELNVKLSNYLDLIEKLKCGKDSLQQQNKILINGLNEERSRIMELTKEKTTTQNELKDIEIRYNHLSKHLMEFEKQIRDDQEQLTNVINFESKEDVNESIQLLQHGSRVLRLKMELEECHSVILRLNDEIAQLQHQLSNLEFQKCELTLRLHEVQGKADTENALNLKLRTAHQNLLSAISSMKDAGKVAVSDYNDLLRVVRSHAELDAGV